MVSGFTLLMYRYQLIITRLMGITFIRTELSSIHNQNIYTGFGQQKFIAPKQAGSETDLTLLKAQNTKRTCRTGFVIL